MYSFTQKLWKRSPERLRLLLQHVIQFARSTPEQRKAALVGLRYEMAGRGISLTRNEAKLLALKDKHHGRRAFIIGNGPSLNQTDVRWLKDEITIGCNAVFLMFDEMGFLPTYYTVEDVLVAEDRADAINSIRGTTKILPRDLNYCLKPDEDTIYINFIRDYSRQVPNFSSDFVRHVFWGGTVTYLNIQLAYYLGCHEVYLIGVDHSYKVPDYAQGTVITSREADVNHFHPDYFGPGYRWHDPKVERMEIAYREAKQFFDENGGVIYNASARTQLDVFSRVLYEELFENG
jgi:hypothetical protein